MMRVRVAGVWSIVSVAIAGGCGGPGGAAETIRPKDPTAAKAFEEAQCHDVEKGGEPLIVDWKPEQRGDLEVAMKDGIAILSYSCQSLKVLPDCKLDGKYGFIGMTRREQVVRLQNADEVKANLPFSGGKIGGEMQRGSTLEIAMLTVGKRRTTWDTPTKDDLKGSCEGATHYVKSAVLGAFAMSTGSEAKVRAAAEILGTGAEAASQSSRETANRDGDVTDCQKASPDAPNPPSQCGAPIRLVLAPIGKGLAGATTAAAPPPEAPKEKAVAASEQTTCPEGLVFSEGKCTKAATAAAYECQSSDLKDCQVQCDKGNAASCGILGEARAEARDYAAALPLLTKGCGGGQARSCANQGIIVGLGLGTKADVPASVALFQKSCEAGDPVGCRELGRNYLFGNAPLTKDEAKAATLFRQGCDGGNVESCSFLAASFEDGKGVAKDLTQATELRKRACDGGMKEACAAAGRAYETGQGAPKNEILAQILYQRGCFRGAGAACTGLGRTQFARQPDMAKRSFEMACNFRDALGCASVKVLYGGNVAFMPNVELANKLNQSCMTGNAPDCTSAALLGLAGGAGGGMAKSQLQTACSRGDAMGCAVQKKAP